MQPTDPEKPYYVDEPTDLSRWAPHDSLLGRLQRGRGQGYFDALAAPRDEAIDSLYRCLTDAVEPDTTAEEAFYYAELLTELRADITPLRTHLLERDDRAWESRTARPVLSTLSAFMLLGRSEAEKWLMDYAEAGTHWTLVLLDVLEVRGPAVWPKVRHVLERVRFRN